MNILIISSNLIGDTILSTGIIQYFINKFPNSKLTIVVGPSSAQVYNNFPNLQRTIKVKKQKFKLHWLKIWRECFFLKWDIIIDFRSSLVCYFLCKKKAVAKSPASRIVFGSNVAIACGMLYCVCVYCLAWCVDCSV